MKFIILIPFVILAISANGQIKSSYTSLKFDKLVMYDYEGGKGPDLYIVDEKGQLAKSIKKQVVLISKSKKNLTASWKTNVLMGRLPHHALTLM